MGNHVILSGAKNPLQILHCVQDDNITNHPELDPSDGSWFGFFLWDGCLRFYSVYLEQELVRDF